MTIGRFMWVWTVFLCSTPMAACGNESLSIAPFVYIAHLGGHERSSPVVPLKNTFIYLGSDGELQHGEYSIDAILHTLHRTKVGKQSLGQVLKEFELPEPVPPQRRSDPSLVVEAQVFWHIRLPDGRESFQSARVSETPAAINVLWDSIASLNKGEREPAPSGLYTQVLGTPSELERDADHVLTSRDLEKDGLLEQVFRNPGRFIATGTLEAPHRSPLGVVFDWDRPLFTRVKGRLFLAQTYQLVTVR